MRFIIPTCLAIFIFALATVVQGMPTQSKSDDWMEFLLKLALLDVDDSDTTYIVLEAKFENGQSNTPNPELDQEVQRKTGDFIMEVVAEERERQRPKPGYLLGQIRRPVFVEGSHFYRKEKNSLHVEFSLTAQLIEDKNGHTEVHAQNTFHGWLAERGPDGKVFGRINW
ncbi:hypothetical protein F5878DRAFT_656226 [Lentinula raphanica]|uniref:Uncharacterized protein n=1 Tax=Lentinula raphanica TaxID=153919 RepID=A0AA38PJW8_9AGAR|nr:hypothetical protein F5878DRAFT_656226 [Lentinula raphanica]